MKTATCFGPDSCVPLNGGGTVVRRVAVNPETGTVSVQANNPQYQDFENISPDNMKVVGRVVWMGHKV